MNQNRQARLDAAWERARREEAGRTFRVRAALVALGWLVALAYALAEKFLAR